ncbi:MAG: Fic family protein [Candidatus Omnitrophota bacterium]
MEEQLKLFTFTRYLNKEEIAYRLSNDISLNDFWAETIRLRKSKADFLPFKDQKGNSFWFCNLPALQKAIHHIDSAGKDSLYKAVSKDIENELVKDSLVEEAFYSSVIEGAFSTIKRMRELVAGRDTPKDHSEQMILNNYKAMQFIFEQKHKELSIDLVLKLHQIITDKTLEKGQEEYAGKFRDDQVYIQDSSGRLIYTPPSAQQVPEAMQRLVEWVNQVEEGTFTHPIIKAAIIHFYLVYIHPFFDGNGRTSRALFYFYLIKNEYEFFKYFSISSVVEKSKAQYYRAIKDVEDYDADLTYFLLYMSNVVLESIGSVTKQIASHYHKHFVFRKIEQEQIFINARQKKFLSSFLVKLSSDIRIKDYQRINKVVYETARRDLEDLYKKSILLRINQKNAFVYKPNYTVGIDG